MKKSVSTLDIKNMISGMKISNGGAEMPSKKRKGNEMQILHSPSSAEKESTPASSKKQKTTPSAIKEKSSKVKNKRIPDELSEEDISEPSSPSTSKKPATRGNSKAKKIINDSESEISSYKGKKNAKGRKTNNIDDDIDSSEMEIINQQFKELEESENKNKKR
jgi:hypothetical protein